MGQVLRQQILKKGGSRLALTMLTQGGGGNLGKLREGLKTRTHNVAQRRKLIKNIDIEICINIDCFFLGKTLY